MSSRGRKIVSAKQLAANRRNALKSTGPKTVNGKSVSKMNAVKHGILSKEVLARGLHIRENAREFTALHQRFTDELNPAGPMEEMLVDQIVTTHWRLRRALTAESGEIALSVDGGWWGRQSNTPLLLELELPPFPTREVLVMRLQHSATGWRYLLYCLRDVRKSVERDGELTQAVFSVFIEGLRGQAGHIGNNLQKFRDCLTNNPEKLEPEALRTQHWEAVMKYLNAEISDLTYRLDEQKRREDHEERAKQAAAVLPSAETLEKILRYETKLERQLFRAMNQLERLQRMRQGENIPAPLTMEVSERG